MKRAFRALLLILAFALVAGSLSSCAKFFGGTRRDLDDSGAYDSPTTGGRWAERGLLDDPNDGKYGGHAERNLASEASEDARTGRSWVTAADADANHRDRLREGDDDSGPAMTMSNTQSLAPPTRRQYKNGARATRADFVDETPNEGSLWGSDGQTNYYFTKNKVRGVGDILTVTMEADMVRDIATEVKRTLSPKEREYELAVAQQKLYLAAAGGTDQVASSAASPNAAPSPAPSPMAKIDPKDVREATPDDVDVAKSLEVKTGDIMMAEILERYPNGNYKIRGTKRIPYKGGRPRLINLIGIARSQDIGEDDVIASGKLYEYRLEATR